MNTARIGAVALLASAALLGCTSDATTPHAFAQGTAVAATAAASAQVDNFMLVDHTLQAHELYRFAEARAVVLVTQANGDAVIRGLAPELKALQAAYAAKGVDFMMLNSSLKDSQEAVFAEASSAGYGLPILMDTYQLVGEQLGVSRSAEVFVIDPKRWAVVYRGPMAATGAALDAMLAGRAPPASTLAGLGAQVAFPERGRQALHARISYSKDVAPILEANCVSCHQEGGIGPFAMTNYDMVKGFSPMIREAIRTDRMPPFNAHPQIGKFADDRNLSAREVKTLVHWIEAGSPRGDGPDPLGATRRVAAEWPLGKPDLLLNVPAYKIPASGVVDYQRPSVVNPLTEGRWIRATTVKPGERQAVHHLLTGWMKEMPTDGRSSETRWQGSVGGYAVGSESSIQPANVGTYLPAGGAVGMQVHYTPFGREATDKSQIAVYFHEKPPELMMRSVVVIDSSIAIPANTARHKELAYVEFPKDALLYSAFPHAHYRAYATDLWIQYPDGKKKLLLALPRYDFNWQRDYTFAEPIKVPAGSRLIAHYVYDNSKRNPSNPDPNLKITWGEQSHEEMLFTSLRFRWLDETAAKPVNHEARFAETRLLGMMDNDIDGKLQKAELRGRMGEIIGPFFATLDKNGDAALDRSELVAAQAMMGGRRRGADAAAAQPTGGR